MWNLTGDDIQRATEELERRRAAIQLEFDSEMSRLDTELADMERVERFAINFALKHRDDAPSTLAVDPAPVVRQASLPTDTVSEQIPTETSTDAVGTPAAGKSPSRWRMSLNGEEASL
jgi:hypothetical protein